MCGRFTLTADPEQLRQAFPWLNLPAGAAGAQPRYNIAPTQPVAVVPNDGQRQLDYFIWGLVPSWAKEPAMGGGTGSSGRMINARAETLAEKPAFRAAFRRRRCLILADGFYEWQALPGRKAKTPMYIRLKDSQPFALAGLWESWNAPDGSNLLSCTIITTQPNALLQPIHNRMPVILEPQSYDLWLDPGELPPGQLQPLLVPYPHQAMTAFPVSTQVNSPANDSPACILPV
ncbi:MAG: SOS response-associated peptidase [Chloroflexota bacterium]